jgi:hypothetical protein
VAEGARLESVFRVKPNVGSNPTLSAKYKKSPCAETQGLFLYLKESNGLVRSLGLDKNIWNIFARVQHGREATKYKGVFRTNRQERLAQPQVAHR